MNDQDSNASDDGGFNDETRTLELLLTKNSWELIDALANQLDYSTEQLVEQLLHKAQMGISPYATEHRNWLADCFDLAAIKAASPDNDEEDAVYENQETLDQQVVNSSPGDYPWDRWKSRAIKAGLDASIAQLGRDVMREAYNHSWSDELKAECGWSDGGKEMLSNAMHNPTKCEQRWIALIRSDGCYAPLTDGPQN